MKSGVIIAVTGPPSSGKSTLARKLAARYGAVLFPEDPAKFPSRVKRSLARGEGLFETELWFRGVEIANQARAEALKAGGRTSILDTFWLTTALYAKAHKLAPFERKLLTHIFLVDLKTLPWPDLVVYLKASRRGTRERLGARPARRRWEKSAAFRKSMLTVLRENGRFFGVLRRRGLLVVDREKFDVRDPHSLERVGRLVDSALRRIAPNASRAVA